jgi:hypothetical protein
LLGFGQKRTKEESVVGDGQCLWPFRVRIKKTMLCSIFLHNLGMFWVKNANFANFYAKIFFFIRTSVLEVSFFRAKLAPTEIFVPRQYWD